MYKIYTLYAFTHQNTFSLFPYLGHCDQCCSEHGVEIPSEDADLNCFAKIPRCEIAVS